jgi:hypothetical protein
MVELLITWSLQWWEPCLQSWELLLYLGLLYLLSHRGVAFINSLQKVQSVVRGQTPLTVLGGRVLLFLQLGRI